MKLISNDLVKAIYAHNVAAGWWADGRPDGTTIALIHSEVSESYKGFKSGEKDPHCPQYPNMLVELADAAIRIYDFFGHKSWNLEYAIGIAQLRGLVTVGPATETDVNFYAYYADLQELVSDALESIRKNVKTQVHTDGSEMDLAAINLAIALSQIYWCVGWGWPLAEAIGDKRAYNANRADHKLSARSEADGKKF